MMKKTEYDKLVKVRNGCFKIIKESEKKQSNSKYEIATVTNPKTGETFEVLVKGPIRRCEVIITKD